MTETLLTILPTCKDRLARMVMRGMQRGMSVCMQLPTKQCPTGMPHRQYQALWQWTDLSKSEGQWDTVQFTLQGVDCQQARLKQA